ncbi:unnamed protein product [Symbiodinium sp. CCMP2592]|nr:unnamed protein product [Symbiodinium sp. CCMP2592]
MEREVKSGKWDWVVWADCDTYFMNMSITVESILFTYAGRDESGELTLDPEVHMIVSEDSAMLNTGIFFVKGTRWAEQLFERVWGGDDSPWINHPWWENAAIAWQFLKDNPRKFASEDLEEWAAKGEDDLHGVYPPEVRVAPQSHFNSYHPITSRFQHDTWEEGKFVIAFNGVLSASSPTVVLGLFATGVSGFPITSLELTKDQFAKLNSTGPRDGLATSLLLPHLSAFFKQAESAIKIESGDIIIEEHFPDTTIDDDCNHKVEALNGHAKGDIKNSSFLTGGLKVSWKSVSVFIDAELDAILDIGGDVRVRIGKHIFGHHCTQLARKTMGLSVDSDGQNGVGINMTASNAHLEYLNSTWYLSFNFHADVVGTVLKWNVDKITADGCKIKILGIEIASVCGYVERHVKDKLQSLLNTVERIDAPKILKKVEDKINTAIGSTVRIPLKLAGQTNTLVMV